MKFNFSSQYFFLFLICFFLYGGYYAGLAFVISFLGDGFTSIYSVPVRLVCSLIMLYFIIKNIKNKINNNYYFFSVFAICFYIILTYAVDLFSQLSFFNKKIEYILYMIVYSLIPFIFFSFIDYKKIKDILVNAIISSGVVLSFMVLYLYKDLMLSGIGRISMLKYEGQDSFLSPLSMSYAASLTISMCFFKLIQINKFSNNLKYLLFILISFIPYNLGASRGSVITLFLSLLLSIIFVAKRSVKIKILMIFPFVLAALIFLSIKMGSAVFVRFMSIGDSYQNQDTSVTNRLGQWNQAFTYIQDNYILGGHFLVEGVYPHNIFLEVGMGQGLFILCLFILCVLFCFKELLITAKKETDAVPLIVFVHGVFMGMFSGSISSSILLFSGMGLLVSVNRFYKGR